MEFSHISFMIFDCLSMITKVTEYVVQPIRIQPRLINKQQHQQTGEGVMVEKVSAPEPNGTHTGTCTATTCTRCIAPPASSTTRRVSHSVSRGTKATGKPRGVTCKIYHKTINGVTTRDWNLYNTLGPEVPVISKVFVY